MAAVPEAFGFRTDRRKEATRDEFPIGFGPVHCEVVTTEIFVRRKRIHLHAFTEVLIHMSAQDGFTQSARAAVNEHNELLFAEVEFLELFNVENLLDRLQFGKVIATTNCAECRIKFRGFEIVFSEKFADEPIPRVFEVELQPSLTTPDPRGLFVW